MKMPLVPLAAVSLGGVSALAAFALPATALDAVISTSDAADWGLQAAPLTAGASHLVFAIAAGAMAAGAGALLARAVLREKRPDLATTAFEPLPTPRIRRADSHPDARPRAPLRATHELDIPAWAAPAAPAAEAPAATERALPVDLDQPLAAFDPLAIPPVPLPPPVPPRRERAASSGLRMSTSRDPADRLVRPETDATVHALLERLERGVVRRNQAAQSRGRVRADRGLDDALAALRSLARQA